MDLNNVMHGHTFVIIRMLIPIAFFIDVEGIWIYYYPPLSLDSTNERCCGIVQQKHSRLGAKGSLLVGQEVRKRVGT